MTVTIGLVANIFQEANALPGWLETHLPYFDDVRVLHAGPQGSRSDDGTIEILEKWRVPITFGSIDAGFGAVRTQAIRLSPCDYVMILDADERFYQYQRSMVCHGQSTPAADADAILQTYDFRNLETMLPNWENVARLGADLRVEYGEVFDQGTLLRELLERDKPDAVCTVRRHWHDLKMTRPTQNWHTDPDWQMRLVRNHCAVQFDPATPMHERLINADKVVQSNTTNGPFFDHFHFTFKRMEQGQRQHDVRIYDAIHAGQKPPTLDELQEELFGGKKKAEPLPLSDKCPYCSSPIRVTKGLWACDTCKKGHWSLLEKPQ